MSRQRPNIFNAAPLLVVGRVWRVAWSAQFHEIWLSQISLTCWLRKTQSARRLSDSRQVGIREHAGQAWCCRNWEADEETKEEHWVNVQETERRFYTDGDVAKLLVHWQQWWTWIERRSLGECGLLHRPRGCWCSGSWMLLFRFFSLWSLSGGVESVFFDACRFHCHRLQDRAFHMTQNKTNSEKN